MSAMSRDARSKSRGREGREEYGSSGRGGVGNIRPQSRDPIARIRGPDDFSPSRGREVRTSYDEPVCAPLSLGR
jgi:hypothetical protein